MYKVGIENGTAWLWTHIVDAANEQEAVDLTADYIEEHDLCGLYRTFEDIEKEDKDVYKYAEDNGLICCGNHGIYIKLGSLAHVFSQDEQREIALKHLKQLHIFNPYITQFEKDGTVTMFENYGGFYATVNNGEEELFNIINDFQSEHRALVYAVTHEYTEFGECYDLLYISQYVNDEPMMLEKLDDYFRVMVFTYNKTYPEYTEMGSILVDAQFGGIKRVA